MKALSEMHDNLSAGHKGFQKTAALVLRRCWWKGIRAAVRDYVSSCPECQIHKADHWKPAGELQPLEFPAKKWQHIGVDFITGLPKATSDYDAIMVVIDRATKMLHLTALNSTATAQDVAVLFVQHTWKLHGVPRSIVSDRDSKFISLFWQHLMRLLGTKLRVSSDFHPQADSQTERVNDVIETTISIYSDHHPLLCDTHLPRVHY